MKNLTQTPKNGRYLGTIQETAAALAGSYYNKQMKYAQWRKFSRILRAGARIDLRQPGRLAPANAVAVTADGKAVITHDHLYGDQCHCWQFRNGASFPGAGRLCPHTAALMLRRQRDEDLPEQDELSPIDAPALRADEPKTTKIYKVIGREEGGWNFRPYNKAKMRRARRGEVVVNSRGRVFHIICGPKRFTAREVSSRLPEYATVDLDMINEELFGG